MTTIPAGRGAIGAASARLACRVLPAGDAPMTAFFAWIRDQMTEGTVIRWTGPLPPALDTAQLHHLPPPAADAAHGGTERRAAAWRAAFRPARCYYRQGPGFLIIKDIRDPLAGARLTIDDPVLAQAFLRHLTPGRLSELTGPDRQAAEDLLSEHMLLRVGDYVTTAPYRMRRWPIPARKA